MKKLFTLLAMVGLAFASCTPEGPEGPNHGGNENQVLGAAEFEISVTNVSETSADLSIAPKQEGRTFYWNIVTEAGLAEYATTAAYMQEYYAYLKENIDAGVATWEQILDNAPIQYTTSKLDPNTKYVLWAFGIDAAGNLTSADLSYVKFETPASTFDPTSWYGYWNVTSQKQVQIGEDPMSGYLIEEVVDEPLEKVIAIIDASADLGEGYVYVYGWDGVFELEMPTIGKISSNTIKLMNETVLFSEEDEKYGQVDYTWLGFSDLSATHGGWYTIGGDYPCYTFTMGADKAATVTAYQGKIGDGTPFMTDYYALQVVIATGEYAGYSLGFVRADGMPACYLTGAEMTAEYIAPIEEVAAQKLNANKKAKTAHKVALKAPAKKFSAAVKLAK